MTGSNEINKDSPNKEIMYAQIDKSIKYLMWNIFSFNDEIQTQMSSTQIDVSISNTSVCLSFI